MPAAYDEAATAKAREMTVRQLRAVLPSYGYEDPGQPKPKPAEAERSVSSGTDAKGWWLRARLSRGRGAVVDAAIRAMRDDLFRQQRALVGPGEALASVSAADGLVCAAEAALRAGEAAHPGSDRYQVHLHLEQGPGGDTSLSTHLGQRLPQWLHQLLLCDCSLRATTYRHGAPVDVGRRTRVISRRVRRIVEHRDGGCRVPGCDATLGLEIHHIVHWEDLGPTDTANLITLCRRHHRMHHQGLLAITGDADLPATADGAVRIADRWNRTMDPVGRGETLPTSVELAQRARDARLEPVAYRSPRGEPLVRRDFTLDEPPRPDPDDDDGPGPRPAWDRPTDHTCPPAAGTERHPTRAGPHAAA
ncbi:MAG: HNH endonuclease signature motif containing protein [Acidimicrobiales bacterium]